MSEPQATFAHELLHGIWLVEQLFNAAAGSVTKPMLERHERLARAIAQVESSLADLYQISGEVWQAEAKAEEAACTQTG